MPDATRRRAVLRAAVPSALAATVAALRQLLGGVGTGLLAASTLGWLAVAALAHLVGAGRLLAPGALAALRAVAERERARLSRWGPPIASAGPAPRAFRASASASGDTRIDPTVRNELRWAARHATLSLALGLACLALPLTAVRDGTFPLWWRLVPPADATAQWGFWQVRDDAGALGVGLLGVVWLLLTVALAPAAARLQAAPGRRLLPPDPATDLALRVAELTATRAAALDAHAAELRRIERSLHDGTQNRLVAVTVLLGAARRALARETHAAAGEVAPDADAIIARAQDAAEQALAELRAVVRGILPPVLTDRSLPDALTSLATTCPIPVLVDADLPGRCAASVEATAYFVVAEALTNVARHSGARQATVTVRRVAGSRLQLRIADDGRGGADERAGSGLAGIRGRTEAHDGTFTLTSPPGGPTVVEVDLPCGS